MRLRARTPGTREARSHWRSARLSRWSFQRNPDDFGAHAAPRTPTHCSGHQATPHEQTECLSEWFFGTDGDDCLGRVAKDRRAAGRVLIVECVSLAFIRSAPRAVEQSYA